jgi:predicted nucleic acid-binding protein
MTLTDTGPLVSLFDVRDTHHAECVTVLSRLSSEPLITTWACFTEAMHILGTVGGYRYQANLWDLRARGLLALHSLTRNEADRMAELMAQYSDTPMDLADASLVAVAETLTVSQVFTFDSDFYIYRLSDGSRLEVIR